MLLLHVVFRHLKFLGGGLAFCYRQPRLGWCIALPVVGCARRDLILLVLGGQGVGEAIRNWSA